MRALLAVLFLAAAVVLGACGESDQEKAQTQVCDARADIRKQVDELKGMTASTASVDGVQENVTAIRDGLRKMADAQGTLSEERRNEVRAATKEFTASVSSIVDGLRTDLSLGEARTRLQSAGQDLAAAYSDSLGRIDCSGS